MHEQGTIKVWDPLVRIFHWSLVLSFSVAYLTEDDFEDLHVDAGYVVLGLVAFRILWGLVGTRYARFSDFVYPLSKVRDYLLSLLGDRPQHYTGHNPAGGWMVIVLLFMLLLTSFSGLQLYAQEGKGPLAGVEPPGLVQAAHASGRDDDDDDDRDRRDRRDDDGLEDFWEDAHELIANLTLVLVFVHVGGVVVSSRLHRENLVKAMITGRKPAPQDPS